MRGVERDGRRGARQDAWPMLKAQFNDAQMAALTNLLVAPTYFS